VNNTSFVVYYKEHAQMYTEYDINTYTHTTIPLQY